MSHDAGDENTGFTGRCLCGDVTIKTIGKPRWVGHCHCPSCQKITGTGFATYAGFERSVVSINGENLKKYHVSPGIDRLFCGVCSSPIAYVSEAWPEEIHLHAAILDQARELHPMGHAYVSAQMPWIHFEEDNTLKFEKIPAYDSANSRLLEMPDGH